MAEKTKELQFGEEVERGARKPRPQQPEPQATPPPQKPQHKPQQERESGSNRD